MQVQWSKQSIRRLMALLGLVVILSPGSHIITLKVTDSDGNTAVKTIRLSAGDRVFLPLIWRAQ